MKLRRIIAAVLCGVMLTGCQADERPQSSAAESVSTTVPEATTTTAAKTTLYPMTMKATTTHQTTTAAPKPKIEKLTVTGIERDSSNGDYADIRLIPVQGDFPAGTDIQIYHGTTEYNMEFECVAYYKSEMISVPCVPGDNYYKLRLTDYEDYGEFSDTLYLYRESGADVHQYTHTFAANHDGWVFIPDYTQALKDINNGIQPESFDVTCKWTCPLCGKYTLTSFVTCSYTQSGSYIIWLSPKCGRSDCPGRKQAISGNRLECYAIQIS